MADLSGRATELHGPAIGAAGRVVAYGHWGRPVLVFPSEAGDAYDFERNGMLDAVGDLVRGGRAKLYCVDSFDAQSWSDPSLSAEASARQHERYVAWIVDQVVPFVHADCGGPTELITFGCSMGAFHAADLALRRADLFGLAICLSGVYDPAEHGLAHADEGHVEWLRQRLSLLLVCGQGQWEDTTGALDSTRRFAALVRSLGIKCELDLWGYDVPHDWPSWRAQIAHHLPRFC